MASGQMACLAPSASERLKANSYLDLHFYCGGRSDWKCLLLIANDTEIKP